MYPSTSPAWARRGSSDGSCPAIAVIRPAEKDAAETRRRTIRSAKRRSFRIRRRLRCARLRNSKPPIVVRLEQLDGLGLEHDLAARRVSAGLRLERHRDDR